ncbi:MAG: hypothetical protein QMD21_03250 [Candidatus Thermoplasmatota archaeon]|nr:hypothetical protein [Candidatus Thermoplasmatota archaeon]
MAAPPKPKSKLPIVIAVVVVVAVVVIASALWLFVFKKEKKEEGAPGPPPAPTVGIVFDVLSATNDGEYVNITYQITFVSRPDVGWGDMQCKFYVNGVSPLGGYFGMNDVDNNNRVSSGDTISITELRVETDVNTGDSVKLELIYLPTNEIAGSLTISAP